MSCRALALLALLLACAAGCSDPPCIRHSDCAVGYFCAGPAGGTCVLLPDAAPETDAGPEPDADDTDAAPAIDAGPEPDADQTDADPSLEPDAA